MTASLLPQTELTQKLGCRYPIVQTAMGWVADANLVAATTQAGGFGFLAAAVMSTQTLREQIAIVRELFLACDVDEDEFS